MKKKLMGVLLVVSMIVSSSTNAFAIAIESGTDGIRILEEKKQGNIGLSNVVTDYKGTTLYTMTSPRLTYCSQITRDGKIQFSYVDLDKNILVESKIIDISKTSKNKNASVQDLESINQTIIENLNQFERARVISAESYSETVRGFNSLDGAISNAFGSSYTGQFIGSATKFHKGKAYVVRATDSQSFSKTTLDTKWFAKNTSLTAIVAWALTGSFSWVGALAAVITAVTAITIVNGITFTKESFTAGRVSVTSMRTRIVTVAGNPNTMYWAGWTRKLNFFRGSLGWTSDYGYVSNVKHPDFDNVSVLLQKGFESYIR